MARKQYWRGRHRYSMDPSLYQELIQHQMTPTVPVPTQLLRTGVHQEATNDDDDNNDETDSAEEKTNDEFEEDDKSDFRYGAA